MVPAKCRARHAACFLASQAPLRIAGYQGPKMENFSDDSACKTLHIVKRGMHTPSPSGPSDGLANTLGWISRSGRLARDFERYARTVAAFVRLAMIRICLDA